MDEAIDLGEYRLVRPLGRGGMGEVWLGHDTLLDRPVAIKLIASRTPDAATRERFVIEARAIARLSHPNVVAVHRAATTIDGRPYLVQELLRGKSLDRLTTPLPWREVRTIGVGIARGLSAAHRRGVLHRDIKPANVMLTDDGVVKLLDFGLAKLAEATVVEPEPAPADPVEPSEVTGEVVVATANLRGPVTGVAETAEIPLGVKRSADGASVTPIAGALTQVGAVIGTPRYLAPELWRGEVGTVASDLYAVGAVLFELVAGRAVHPERDLMALRDAVLARDAPPLLEVAPEVDPRLASLLDRCLRRDPAERPASAETVVHELELLAAVAVALPDGNPYRGLRAFEAEQRALFFGRGTDVSAIVDRLRGERLVVVAGDSGVGKSSVCRAGVLPEIVAGALGDERTWRSITVTPGRHPVASVMPAIPKALAPGDGLLVLIDQAEELVTAAEPTEAAEVTRALVAAVDALPGLRVLCTVRGDLLTRFAALPSFAGPVGRGLHLLGPLDDAGLREAIIGPARARGVELSDPATVDALVAAARGRGGLPLLSFALAELWVRRDVAHARIPPAALEAIGGVAGALTRHADGVIAALGSAERIAARRILTRLVTVDGTGDQRRADELFPEDPATAGALDALVRGRLVVARDAPDGATYHLAHDALIVGWPTLRGWLDEDVGLRAARARLETAASEWERVGRRRDALWSRRALADADRLGELSPREAAFLAASRRAARRARILRITAAIAVPAVVAAVYLGVRAQQRAARDHQIAAYVESSDDALAEAHVVAQEVETTRADAFARFDREEPAAEDVWVRSLGLAAEARAKYRRAVADLEAALLLEPRAELRHRMATLLYEQALLAERDHDAEALDDLRRRLATYDDGTVGRQWDAPATLTVTLSPPARATLRCFSDDRGLRVLGPPLVTAEGPTLSATVPPASCVIEASAPGRVTVRAPLVLHRKETRALAVGVPAAGTAPRDFVYVPAGRFLYGAAQDESLRRELHAPPIHEVELPAFWIARHETTMAEWIAWLRTLPPAERERRRPVTEGNFAGMLALHVEGEEITFELRRAGAVYLAREGEPVRFQGRERRAEQRWERFPVAGVSAIDVVAYAAWLDDPQRIPGARLCTAREWERAGRGADDRQYPHGDRLGDDDTDHDTTYGRVPEAFGPDEVGSHPASDSPFGVADLAGNVWEWVAPSGGTQYYRGGGWYDGALSSLLVNREIGERDMRDALVGVRICTSVP